MLLAEHAKRGVKLAIEGAQLDPLFVKTRGLNPGVALNFRIVDLTALA